MTTVNQTPAPRPSSTTPARRYRRDPAWTNEVERSEPVADRHLTGAHWWDPDRLAHRRDSPAFCPGCAASLDAPGSLSVEYWEADLRTFHVRCAACSWSGDITRVERMVGHEAPHD